MRLPRIFTTGLWLAVTVASTGMVWTATSIVAADVTDRPATVLAHQDVVSQLGSGPPAERAAPPTTPPTTAGATSTTSTPGRAASPATPTTPTPPLPRTPAVTVVPSPPPTLAVTPGPPAPRPTTPPPQRPTASYSTAGGVVRVACNGFFIDLLSAIPANGYAVKVAAGGPANVDVHFVRSGQDLSVKAVCFGQPIRYYDPAPPTRTGTGGAPSR